MSTFVVIGMSSHVSVRDDSVAQHQSYTHSSHLQIETFCCHYSQMALCVPISSHSSMFHSILQRLPSGFANPRHIGRHWKPSQSHVHLAHLLQHGRGGPEIETKCIPNKAFGRRSVGPLSSLSFHSLSHINRPQTHGINAQLSAIQTYVCICLYIYINIHLPITNVYTYIYFLKPYIYVHMSTVFKPVEQYKSTMHFLYKDTCAKPSASICIDIRSAYIYI